MLAQSLAQPDEKRAKLLRRTNSVSCIQEPLVKGKIIFPQSLTIALTIVNYFLKPEKKDELN